jgi:microcystin-dependent protein
MDEPYIGTISMVSFNFAPVGWLPCNGQLLPIVNYTSLFSLLGIRFGGDGVNNFALPDLRGRTPVGPGPYRLGDQGGRETVTLTSQEAPAHGHAVAANAAGGKAATSNPAGAVPAGGSGKNIYAGAPDTSTMASQMLSPAGNNQAHPNQQPFLGINYIIAYEGQYPPRT